MIEIARFDHISVAAPSLGPQVEVMERLFGFRPSGQFESDEGYTGITLAIAGPSDVRWEVIAPQGRDSFLHRFLAGPHGPGLHHVAIDVKSMQQAQKALRMEEAEPWGLAEVDEESVPETIYLHPRDGGRGILWQLNATHEESEPVEAFDDDSTSTVGVIAVNHLAHATADRRDLAAWYERMFGCGTVWESSAAGAENGFLTQIVEAPTQPFRFEAIEPAGPNSFIAQFIAQRGEAMHHVTFEVGNWARAMQACRAQKVPVFGERAGPQWNEAFIHPRYLGGVLVQLFWEERPGTWV